LLSGAISKIGVTLLFLFSGVTVIVVTSFLFRTPEFWQNE
jgi:uncharacterized membrane protein YkgB